MALIIIRHYDFKSLLSEDDDGSSRTGGKIGEFEVLGSSNAGTYGGFLVSDCPSASSITILLGGSRNLTCFVGASSTCFQPLDSSPLVTVCRGVSKAAD